MASKAALCILAFAAAAFAQPSVTDGNAAPKAGDVFTLSAGITGPVGAGGADQTWDFSGATIGAYGTLTFASPAGTPYVGKFPEATVAMGLAANANPGSSKWDYYKLSANKWEHLGANFGGQDGDDFTQDPITEIWFPLAYGDSIEDTYCKKNRTDTTHVGLKYDGYGTLKLPDGSHTVFRIRRDYGTYVKTDFYTTDPLFVLASHNSGNNLLAVYAPKAASALRGARARIIAKREAGFVLLNGWSTITQELLRGVDGRTAPVRASGFRVLKP